jgi:hypothetical protein
MSAAAAFDLIARQCRPVPDAVRELCARFPDLLPESAQDICSDVAALNAAEREALAPLLPQPEAGST